MKGHRPRFKGGSWLVVCDISGRLIYSSEAKKRWDNAITAPEHWEPRQIQDYVRGTKDDRSVPFSRPDQDYDIAILGEVIPTPPFGTPTAPSLLIATSPIASQVLLTWTDNSSDETRFVIERKFTNSPSDPSQNGHFPLINSVAADVITFTDLGLTSGQNFDYRVSAINSSGLSSPSNIATIVVS